MILYLDASALVKLYVEEVGTSVVAGRIQRAEAVATVLINLTDGLVRSAGALAERHALRGYDAVQLAAAIDLRAAGADVEFCAFDTHLNRAARREHLVVSDV